ncbi:MAG: sugar kinase [Rhodoglobus sp.]
MASPTTPRPVEEARRKTNARVVCMGETMAQIVPVGGAGLVDADMYRMGQAGAESNVAISLARLGTRAAWASIVGLDPIGERIRTEIEKHGVDTSLVRVRPHGRTGIFFKDPGKEGSKVFYYRGGSAAASMDAEFAREIIASGPRWLHVTGVTTALSDSCREAVTVAMREARGAGIPVSFDVNYRPSLWPSVAVAGETIRVAAESSDVVFIGLDEAHAIWGCVNAADVRLVLPTPATLIVKDGSLECTSFSTLGTTVVPALVVDVVEPVGAGDAFAAGWIHGHLAGLDESMALRLGHLMAGVALTASSDHGDIDGDPQLLVGRAVSGVDWNETDPSATPSLSHQL